MFCFKKNHKTNNYFDSIGVNREKILQYQELHDKASLMTMTEILNKNQNKINLIK